MNTALLTRTIDPSLPLPDALAMLRGAQQIAARTAPAVKATSASRRMRPFRRAYSMSTGMLAASLPRATVSRAAPLVQASAAPSRGATRYFSRDVGRVFSARSGLAAEPRSTRMASHMLLAAGMARTVTGNAPRLDLLARLHRQALALAGTLQNRFDMAARDIMPDRKADMNRTAVFQQRYGGLRFAI